MEKREAYTKNGYIYDTNVLRLDLYRLLCYFIASEKLNEYEPDFEEMLNEFQNDQIKIILISTAANVRVIDDRDGYYLNKFNKIKCGTLNIGNGKKKETQNLGIREVCNKIIHAKDIRFEVFDNLNRYKLKPFVHLFGSKDGVKWRATIDIIEFVKAVEHLVC